MTHKSMKTQSSVARCSRHGHACAYSYEPWLKRDHIGVPQDPYQRAIRLYMKSFDREATRSK